MGAAESKTKQVQDISNETNIKSTSNVDVINSTDLGISNETYNKIDNQCKSTTNQSNVLNIIGTNATKLTTSQKNIAQNICILKTAINNVSKAEEKSAMMNNLQAALNASAKNAQESQSKASASAAIGFAPLSFAKGESEAYLTSKNKTNVDQTSNQNISNFLNMKLSQKTINDTIMGCINDIDQSNVMNIIGSNVSESNLEQGNDYMTKCISEHGVANTSTGTQDTTTGTTAENTGTVSAVSDQKSKAVTTSSAVADMFGGGSMIYIILIICCCLSILSSSAAAAM
jgi:hypothetical protein